MPWYFPWSESLKKRACRYLLQYYLGNFLKEKLTLDQLSVDLYNGTGLIKDVHLDVWTLNEALENYNVPFEIVDGFIGSISMSIPWSALVHDNTILEISGLELTVQPKQRHDKGTGVMLDSMFGSMTTSLQLAQECLKHESGTESDQQQSSQPFEGLEMFAQTIESVLTKVKVSVKDSIFRLEHTIPNTKVGIGLEVKVARIDYFDDLAKDDGSPVDSTVPNRNIYEPAAKAHKNFHLMGVTVFTDQFSESDKAMSSRSTSFYSTSQGSPRTIESISPPLSPIEDQTQHPLQSNIDSPKSSRVPVIQSEPVKMAICQGKQELKLKIKQREELPGPKLEVDCQLGSVHMHLSPSQLHLLTELVNSMLTPAKSSEDGHLHSMNKPMQPDDYSKVEHELQKQLHDVRIAEHKATKYTETDDVITQAQHIPVDSDDEMYYDLLTSQTSGPSNMDSSFSSTVTSKSSASQASSYRHNYGTVYYQQTKESPFQATLPRAVIQQPKPRPKVKDTLHRLLDDPTSEVTKFKVKLSFFSLAVLHEDPVVTPVSENSEQSKSGMERLKGVSEAYFSQVVSVATTGQDLAALRGAFAEVCPYDHLQLLGKPFNLDLTQKLGSINSLRGEVSVGLFDFVECLFDRRAATSSILGFSLPIDNILPTYTELLAFQCDVPDVPTQMFSSMQAGGAPCIKVQIQSIQKSPSGSRRHVEPKTEVSVELGRCHCELDITLMDRLNALLNPQPIYTSADLNASRYYKSYNANLCVSQQQSYFRQVIDEGSTTADSSLDIRVSSPFASLTFKFPIPDLRSGQGADRRPWWKKSVRKESLILDITEADFHTTMSSTNSSSKFEFMCKDIHGLFQYSPQETPVSFIRVSHGNDHSNMMSGKDSGFDRPRVVVTTFAQSHSLLEDDFEENDDSLPPQDSLNGACQFAKTEPSPFSAKKAMYENEEKVMPGDREEINNFQEKSASNTQLLVEISLPNLNVVFPDKQFFEVLYNRINNDLLLWEPLAPAPLTTQDGINAGLGTGIWNLDIAAQMLQQEGISDKFLLCRSERQYDSSSDSDEGSGQFYSAKDYKMKQRRKRKLEQAHQQSKVCLVFNVTKGSLLMCMPLLDDLGKVSEEFQGHLRLDLSEGNFVLNVAHNGDPEIQLLSITANQAAVFHSGKEPIPKTRTDVERLDRLYSTHLDPTFYLAEPGVHTKLSGKVGYGVDSIDQLAVALRIKMDTFRNVKEFLVALGLRGTTLHHCVVPSDQTWLTQITSFFSVEDYPILGYTMPTVLTELHIHFTGCSVDYRPRSLPTRAMLTVENFSISSNIVADSVTSLLRFIVEDAALYISQQTNAASVDLKKHYVCVVDVGLFELSLRCSDGKDPKYPKTDLWASNNIVHIHTCADSCKVLQDLIKYMASDADLENFSDGESSSPGGRSVSVTPDRKVAEAQTLSDSPKLRQSHMEEVPDMMEDAMRESASDLQQSDSDSQDEDKLALRGAEVFFFPDEAQKQTVAMDTQTTVVEVMMDSDSHQMSESGSVSDDTERYSEDEEFCIIDDPGLGIAPRGNEPAIRVLTDEPLVIHENFFTTPLTKADQLKAPDSFPAPVYKYSLKDMSLVWNMYGGSDFSRSTREEERKHAGFEVHYTSHGAEIYTAPHTSPKGKKIGWQQRGGPGRDLDTHMELDLFKVSMQHEVYPESSSHASRQILIINDIEIRDRLATSKINKFLYQYSSEALPRRSNANMLLVKAVHRRPDPNLPAQECSLKISLHPIRLNVDQDSLFFIGKFFSDMSDEEKEIGSKAKDSGKPYTLAPVMTVGGQTATTEPDPQELLLMFDTMTTSGDQQDSSYDDSVMSSGDDSTHADGGVTMATSSESSSSASHALPIYFKRFIFSPDVLIRVDYHGKRVDMQQGTLAGLIVGLAQLNCSELRLKRLDHRHGLLGVDRLAMYAVKEWITDIKNHQLPSILGGVGPLHSFVQLYQGVRDLFWLPVEQFRKDGRIVRGLQRGAQSFTMSTAAAALELTNRMVQAVQFVAEITYDMVSPGPSVRKRKRHKLYRRIAQPSDLREGVTNAYIVMREGITGTASEILKAATEEHQHKGVSGAVGGVLRQIPPTVIQPVILATEATSEVLGGMRNQLLPDARKEQEEKWKQQQ